ncbi:tRNA uridine-5-carboxymethylaminomethyl(34) synthesis GTPase MnmE [Oceanivirga salmonicida]|uniref:tRNA uridine-5-carboxymethylaminomethyl(34) synthesis GTPase MnmE n=1 Tax=Oceanivirga salmonicida TaxID=1769291 RepID=UPI00082A9405|nr:tRNA uridine-5-carboxymethylaminomethyl(34) synthesis GTPase MnmE [Oceanivirga salmonicida]
MLFQTVAAIATPKGEGGIGIIRISGDKSFEILDKIFKLYKGTKIGNYKLRYGYVHDNGKVLDEVMAVRMKGPKSYTAEDVVEINCHGGYLITQRVLELILKNGAVLAPKGEFTKRAFMNGRIDLSQAEAVIDLIDGKSEKALDISIKNLRGDLKEMINDFKKTLLDITAHVNVVLDYPEEGIDDPVPTNLLEDLRQVQNKATKLIESYNKGKLIKNGIKTAIVGKPNVGKSTLLNSILREERAIVTNVAGTTRDSIEETINIKGIPLILVDTAGIRKTDDIVESIGVKKTKEIISKADLVLMILDSSSNFTKEDKEIVEYIKNEDKKVIYILNKIDLERKIELDYIKNENIIEISAMKNIGIDDMENVLYNYITENEVNDTGEKQILTNIRHKTALEKTKLAIENIFNTIEIGLPLDLISVDLKEALDALSEITGEITSEDILDHIFSSFCVGK